MSNDRSLNHSITSIFMKLQLFLFIISFTLALVSAIKAQAQLAETKILTLQAAKKIASQARQYALDNYAPGASIAVVDAGGELIYLERLDNTFAASALVAYEKAHTAALFKLPSRKLEESITSGRTPLITVGYTMLIGGIPISVDNTVIGAIGVSGAASAQQDEEIAIAGSKAKLVQ
jgi:glc operon protein GlcG